MRLVCSLLGTEDSCKGDGRELTVHGRAVDMAGTAPDAAGHRQGILDIVAKHGRDQAVLCVVCKLDGFFVGLELEQRYNRAKRLLVVDVHALLDILKHKRLYNGALDRETPAICRSTLRKGISDQLLNTATSNGADERAEGGCCVGPGVCSME